MPDVPTVGSLRQPITVVRRVHRPDTGTGIDETDQFRAVARAEIIPVGAVAYWSGMTLDPSAPYSHRIRMRHLAGLDVRDEIRHAYSLPDGTPVVDRYRVLRVRTLDQSRRFVEVEASLMGSDLP